MNKSLSNLGDSATALADSVAHTAEQMTHRSLEAVRDGSRQLQEQAHHAKISTLGYIKDEPVKSVLIAAAVGAALMALVNLVSHSGGHRH